MTQQFRRKAGSASKVGWSTKLTWFVGLDIDHRGNITGMAASAFYGTEGDGIMATHAVKVGPFDDVDTILDTCMLEAALKLGEQLTLF